MDKQEAENERAKIGGNKPPLSESERLALEYETLSERVADILTKARDEIPQVIETDEQNAKIADIVRGFRAIAGDAEKAKDAEKRPHIDANKAIEEFFKTLTSRLIRGREIIEKRGKTFLDAKAEAERLRREEAAKIAREEANARMLAAQAEEEAGREVHAAISLDQAAVADTRAQLAEEAAQERPNDLARTRFAGGGHATLRTEWKFEIVDITKIDLNALRSFFAAAEIEKAVRGAVKNQVRQLAGVRIFEETKAQYR